MIKKPKLSRAPSFMSLKKNTLQKNPEHVKPSQTNSPTTQQNAISEALPFSKIELQILVENLLKTDNVRAQYLAKQLQRCLQSAYIENDLRCVLSCDNLGREFLRALFAKELKDLNDIKNDIPALQTLLSWRINLGK